MRTDEMFVGWTCFCGATGSGLADRARHQWEHVHPRKLRIRLDDLRDGYEVHPFTLLEIVAEDAERTPAQVRLALTLSGRSNVLSQRLHSGDLRRLRNALHLAAADWPWADADLPSFFTPVVTSQRR